MPVSTPPCVSDPAVFDDELLHSPPSRAELSTEDWSRLVARKAEAHRRCAGCSVMVECLYRAVVEVDVSGFVACTTEADRQIIRRELGITIQHAASAPYGAPRVGGGPVDHEAVMTARQAYPKDTCHQLAERLGCSTSTIKRHLRRERERSAGACGAAPSTPPPRPSVEAVLECFDRLDSSKVA